MLQKPVIIVFITEFNIHYYISNSLNLNLLEVALQINSNISSIFSFKTYLHLTYSIKSYIYKTYFSSTKFKNNTTLKLFWPILGQRKNSLVIFFMKKENEFSCLFGHNIISISLYQTIRNNIADKI